MLAATGMQGISAATFGEGVRAAPTASEHDRPTSGAYAVGSVESVDRDQGKVLIVHGPIVNLGMPGMTMLFRVIKRSLLDNLSAGDKVRFRAEKMQGTLYIVDILRQEPAGIGPQRTPPAVPDLAELAA